MTTFDNLLKLPQTNHPHGFQPGSSWDGVTGHITIPPRETEPTKEEWDNILHINGYDPEKYMVVGSVKHSTNVNADGEVRQTWYKATIQMRPERTFDIEDLIASFKDYQPPEHIPTARKYRLIMISDQHIGKSTIEGGGSDIIAQRWLDGVEKALADGPFEEIHIALGGDTIEGYVSQNGSNIAGTDLTVEESCRVAQHLLAQTITRARSVSNKVSVSVVPGNHGEITRVQKRPMTDSYDIMIASNVHQMIEFAGIAGVNFYFPQEGSGDVTFRFGESIITLVHGHLFRGQMKGAEKWWSTQTLNGHPPGAANILLAGHFHNFQMANIAKDRWVVFAPSLETASTWFKNATGTMAQNGIISLDINADGAPHNVRINY